MSAAVTSTDPATLVVLGTSPVCGAAEVDAAVRRAAAAGPDWAADLPARRSALRSAAERIRAAAPTLAAALTAEQGKPLAEAHQELWVTAEAFAAAAETDFAPTETARARAGREVTLAHRPRGVVAAIVPWNFPLYLAAAKIAPALLAGNTVVVKPAETVSLVVSAFIETVHAAVPKDVIGVVTGGPETASALIDHRLTRMVSFTGSTAVGAKIMARAARTITPVALELGGNDPAILLPGADIGAAAARLAAGAMMNAGQMCIAPKRAYVPAAMAGEFAEAFATAAARTVGAGAAEGTTMGPLHNRRQLDYVHGLIDDAVTRGGRILAGGVRAHELPGHFLDPTVITGVDDRARVVAEEQFGPVFPVVAYTDLDAVLATLDAQEFGLGASVWSADLEAATAVAGRIDAGTVWLNQHNALDVALPFGGVKASGFGREGGAYGVAEFTSPTVIDPVAGGADR